MTASNEPLAHRFHRLLTLMSAARAKPIIRLPTHLVRGPPKTATHLAVGTVTPLAIATREGAYYILHGVRGLLHARERQEPTLCAQLVTGLIATDVRQHYALVVLSAHVRRTVPPAECTPLLAYVWRREGTAFRTLLPTLRAFGPMPRALLARARGLEDSGHGFDPRAVHSAKRTPRPCAGAIAQRRPTPARPRGGGAMDDRLRDVARNEALYCSPTRALDFEDEASSPVKRKAASPLPRSRKAPRRSRELTPGRRGRSARFSGTLSPASYRR